MKISLLTLFLIVAPFINIAAMGANLTWSCKSPPVLDEYKCIDNFKRGAFGGNWSCPITDIKCNIHPQLGWACSATSTECSNVVPEKSKSGKVVSGCNNNEMVVQSVKLPPGMDFSVTDKTRFVLTDLCVKIIGAYKNPCTRGFHVSGVDCIQDTNSGQGHR